MKQFLRFLKAVFCLPFLPTCLIFIIFVALAVVSLSAPVMPWIAYGSYALSAYGLTLAVTYVVRVVRTGYGWRDLPPVKWFLLTRFGQRLAGDGIFRTKAGMTFGLLLHGAYVAVNFVFGVVYTSFWFTTIGIYYLLLVLLHTALIRLVGRAAGDLALAYRRYRLCGILTLCLVPVIALIVFFMVYFDRGYTYPGLLIYVMAAYAFYAVTISIVRMVRHTNREDPILAADRCVDMCAALVSILTLESAMLTQFGRGDVAFRILMTTLTGVGVCVLVLAVGISMIVRSTTQINKLK